MNKTENKKLYSERLFSWFFIDNKKRSFLICLIIYSIIFVVLLALAFHANGGAAALFKDLSNYPENDYQLLETEFYNVIDEGNGIHPENLSNEKIICDISYNSLYYPKGTTVVKLHYNRAGITATIGKNYKIENAKIERSDKTVSEYRFSQYFQFIGSMLLAPLLSVLILMLVYMSFAIALLPLDILRLKKSSKK